MKIGEGIRSLIKGCDWFSVGTSDQAGGVHLAVAGDLKIPDDEHFAFEDWFCHKTLENIKVNPRITIGAVDPRTKRGYQLIGEVERVNLGDIINGFAKEKKEELRHYPQSAHQLSIRVDRILELNVRPHSDEEIR